MNKKNETSKKTQRTPQHTISQQPTAKKRTKPSYRDYYYCTLTWRKVPTPVEIIEKIAKDFHRFAYELAFNTPNPEPYTFHAWRARIGLPRDTYNTWYDKYPWFKKIINEGKEMLGYIRERGMLKKELSERSTMFTMHHFSPEWHEMNKYHSELKAQTESKEDTLLVIHDAKDLAKLQAHK